MRGIGTDDPWIIEEHSGHFGMASVAVHYRRPLRLDEVNRMGPTPDAVARPGRA